MRSSRRARAAGEGLSAFFEHAEREGPASLLVFAPSRPGPWLAQLASGGAAPQAARRDRHRRRVRARASRRWLVRLFAFHEPRRRARSPPTSSRCCASWREAGAEVDRARPRLGPTLSAVHRKAIARARGAARAEVA